MKATIDFDPVLYRRLKVEAARRGRTVLADARVQSSGIAKAVLSASLNSLNTRNAPGLMDRLIHADYARDDISLVTFDRNLSRLPGANIRK